MIDKIKQRLEELAPGAITGEVKDPAGDDILYIDRTRIVEVCGHLKNDEALDFKMLVDLTAVDMIAWPDYAEGQERFEVVYILFSFSSNYYLRLKAKVPEDDAQVESVYQIWKSANFPEREAWEMYGVNFLGHPDITEERPHPRRLLLYESFVGHPLRKDYPLKGHQPTVPLLFPIEIREDPAHQSSEWERRNFIPMPLKEITNDQLLPTSMLADRQPPEEE